jgi:hypothetical protein
VTNAHDNRHNTVDAVLLELSDRLDVVAAKYGVEADELDQLEDAPAEWTDINRAWKVRQSQVVSEVLLSAGEPALEAEMRERPEELAARMAVWEERVEREKAEGQLR